jgi:hypothetical protein
VWLSMAFPCGFCDSFLKFVTVSSVISFLFIGRCITCVIETALSENLGLDHSTSAQQRIVCTC